MSTRNLRQVLARPVAGPFSRTYCGNGLRSACRLALWQALSTADKGGPDALGQPSHLQQVVQVGAP